MTGPVDGPGPVDVRGGSSDWGKGKNCYYSSCLLPEHAVLENQKV